MRLDLVVQQIADDLLDGGGVCASAFRPDARHHVRGGRDLHALPRVAGGVDVGEVLAGDFHAGHLRLQRPRGQVQGAEESEHNVFLLVVFVFCGKKSADGLIQRPGRDGGRGNVTAPVVGGRADGGKN